MVFYVQRLNRVFFTSGPFPLGSSGTVSVDSFHSVPTRSVQECVVQTVLVCNHGDQVRSDGVRSPFVWGRPSSQTVAVLCYM